MDQNTICDIIDWDIVNWSRALDYWEENIDFANKKYNCLELGGRKGGLSLWLALKGNQALCSDLESPVKFAKQIHEKYPCNNLIQYRSIDATKIPFENEFDLIVFKSILGGIGRNGKNELKKKTIEEIYKALKVNGAVLFAENTAASSLHKFLRKKFVKWGDGEWNYLKYDEVESLFSSFRKVRYITVGFMGAFGRNEFQRGVLGRIDRLLDRFVPKRKRYILIGIAEK